MGSPQGLTCNASPKDCSYALSPYAASPRLAEAWQVGGEAGRALAPARDTWVRFPGQLYTGVGGWATLTSTSTLTLGCSENFNFSQTMAETPQLGH